jgi:hypothetical protein
MLFNPTQLDKAVQVELNVFVVSLSHLPVGLQLDVLQDATKQIVDAIEMSVKSV